MRIVVVPRTVRVPFQLKRTNVLRSELIETYLKLYLAN